MFPPYCYCHPAARAQSSFSLREAAFGDVQKNTLHRAPVVQGPSGSDWSAVLGMDGRLLLARSAEWPVNVKFIITQSTAYCNRSAEEAESPAFSS